MAKVYYKFRNNSIKPLSSCFATQRKLEIRFQSFIRESRSISLSSKELYVHGFTSREMNEVVYQVHFSFQLFNHFLSCFIQLEIFLGLQFSSPTRNISIVLNHWITKVTVYRSFCPNLFCVVAASFTLYKCVILSHFS